MHELQKTAKLLRHSADKKAGDFSGARASFFVRLSIQIGAGTGKNNGIQSGRPQPVILFLGFFKGGTYESQIGQNHIVVDAYLIGSVNGRLHAEMHDQWPGGGC
jgi:hypothetical protein